MDINELKILFADSIINAAELRKNLQHSQAELLATKAELEALKNKPSAKKRK